MERARAGKKLATSDREREVDSNGDSASEVDSDGRDAERGHQKEHRLPQEPKTRRREKRQEAVCILYSNNPSWNIFIKPLHLKT